MRKYFYRIIMFFALGLSIFICFSAIMQEAEAAFEKVADPTGGLPAGDGKGAAFSPDGTYLAIVHATTPFVTIYKHTTGDAFEKIADPTGG